ncbi:tail fiber assembly protein [Enterobacter sp. HK169]|uniref:tail fiber assembly protein n=1 Tax=Enterobacter sp. HK169 TaxID=1868135 RepID=UPI000845F96D|nr:tail fiber assembly protein [Enterobacter sp. HK169]AOL12120.1 Caudovirales tail fiber assembly protein [Enterobacter sp. HK169]
MNKYLYDARTNAFYPFGLQADYEAAAMWPENGVEIDEETFSEFQKPPISKMRVAGDDGHPAWADIPPLTDEEQNAMADSQKQLLIDQANEYINSKQWPGKAAMGRLKDSEKSQYNDWLDYLDELEAIDTATAPDIEWPERPE